MFFNLSNRKVLAKIKGSDKYPDINGTVEFIQVPGGTRVNVYVRGLPEYKPATNATPPIGPHGFHIHEEGICEESKDFISAGGHYNPYNQPHGNHAGDFPVLFSNNGIASMSFFTNKFKPTDIINKAVIIHENPDDYRTQPAGDARERIACGIIKEV